MENGHVEYLNGTREIVKENKGNWTDEIDVWSKLFVGCSRLTRLEKLSSNSKWWMIVYDDDDVRGNENFNLINNRWYLE